MPKFKLGTYKVKCDRTGATFRSDQVRPTWDNNLVDKNNYYPRNPQDVMALPPISASAVHRRGSDYMAVPALRAFSRGFSRGYA